MRSVYSEAWWWHGVALRLFCFHLHWKSAMCGRKDGLKNQEILGENLLGKNNPVCGCWSFGIPWPTWTMISSMPLSPPRLGFRISLARFLDGHHSHMTGPHRNSLLYLKKVVAERKSKNIRVRDCQWGILRNTVRSWCLGSHLQQVITAKQWATKY